MFHTQDRPGEWCRRHESSPLPYGGRVEPTARLGDHGKGSRRTQLRTQERRRALIQAGVDVLAADGWSALTSRAVAERARATPSLVHYHFGDQAGLKRSIASAVVEDAFEPVLTALLSAESWAEGVGTVLENASRSDDDPARISAALFAASVHDDEVALVLRQALADARLRLVPWLNNQGVKNPEGLALVIVALLDGLQLHRLIDSRLSLEEASRAVSSDMRHAQSPGED